MRQFVLLLAGLAAVTSTGFAAPPTEYGTWEHTIGNTLPAAKRLRVMTRGSVTVRGAATDQIRYVLHVRAEMITRTQANRLEKSRILRVRNTGGVAELTVFYPGNEPIESHLEIVAPTALVGTDLKAQMGDVEAYDIAGGVVAITAGGKVQMDRIGGEVTARTGGGDIRLGQMGSSVRCVSAGGSIEVDRAEGEAWFETSGGDILLRDAVGEVHASTAGGNIRVQNAAASVVANTGGGRIDVHRAGGTVFAANTEGSIQVGTAAGVRCESTGGLIKLKGATGSLRAVTEAGSILAELVRGAKLENSVLSTGAGDITVFIPSNLALTVRAEREAGRVGRIVSEFPEIAVKRLNSSPSSALRAEGSLNGGGPVLQISVGGGTIYLRRVK